MRNVVILSQQEGTQAEAPELKVYQATQKLLSELTDPAKAIYYKGHDVH